MPRTYDKNDWRSGCPMCGCTMYQDLGPCSGETELLKIMDLLQPYLHEPFRSGTTVAAPSEIARVVITNLVDNLHLAESRLAADRMAADAQKPRSTDAS